MIDHHVFITGGSAGIGQAIAKRLVREGAVVHLNGRRETALRESKAQLGDRAHIYPGDLADALTREHIMNDLEQACGGKLDGLVLNAAKYGFQNLTDMSLADFDHYIQVNVVANFHLAKLAYPLLKIGTGKSVLMISSTLGNRPIPGVGAYASSKAALNMLTQSLALEWAADRIRVNAILPGVVDTDIHEPQLDGDPSRDEKLSHIGPMHPLGRVGHPEEIADAAYFLLSTQSAWTTGALNFIDGGISLV